MPTALESLAEKIRQHPKLVIADDFEIALQKSSSQSTRYHNGRKRQENRREDLWVSLRILHRKRGGRSAVLNPGHEALGLLVESAFESANRATVDPWFRFPLWKALPKSEPQTGAPFDDASLYAHATGCEILEETYENRIVETYLRRKTERLDRQYGTQAQSATYSLMVRPGDETVFVQEERRQAGGLPQRQQWLTEAVHAANERARRAPKPAGRGRKKAVFSPRIAALLLSEMASWFFADQVHAGQSPLSEGQKPPEFSPALSLVDCGQEAGVPDAMPFDLEGVPTQRTVLVDKGSVQSWLFDAYSATRENRLSTGSFLRDAAEMFPRIGARALHWAPGEKSRQGLLEQMGNGLYIDQVEAWEPEIGAPGCFYFRGSGWRVAFGQCSEPLGAVQGRWDLRSLWRSASAAARDLNFYGRVGSPSILVEELPLGG